MELFAQSQQRSRLGQILIKKKLISNEQLAKAMTRQATTGERLGDILAEWNLVTNRHIESALRAQRNVRLVASIVTAMLSPLISACGGGGTDEPKPAPQMSAAQRAAAAVQNADTTIQSTPIATATASENTPQAATSDRSTNSPWWLTSDSVCCTPVANTNAVSPQAAANPGVTSPSVTTSTQTAAAPSTQTSGIESTTTDSLISAAMSVVTAVTDSITSLVTSPEVTQTTESTQTRSSSTAPATKVSDTTQAVATRAPTSLAAQATSATRITLSWADNSGGQTKYRIYRDGGATALAELTGATYTDYTVSANTGYSYQIRAVNTADSSGVLGLLTFPFVVTPAEQNALASTSSTKNGNISAFSQGLGARAGSCDLSHTAFC